MGKDWKSYELSAIGHLSDSEPLQWEKIEKVVNQVKLTVPSDCELLWWGKIGKL